MRENELRERVTAAAEQHGVPGVAAAIWNDGEQHEAFHGVTSIDNPLDVNARTLFQIGSIAKTFTATAIARLAEEGLVELDAPVHRHVPELRLKDEAAAKGATIRHLLNHTAGWAGDLFADTGWGDDALARYVEELSKVEQETPLGEVVSYNNAAFALAGRVIEKVTGMAFERAMQDLVFDPLGLRDCFYFPNDIMTRRFVAGHLRLPDSTVAVARPWAFPRATAPAGGISATLGDLIAWARFHMGDGRAVDSTQVLSEPTLRTMQEPSADARGTALGDWIGLSWLMRDVGEVRLIGHDGGTNGHTASLLMAPERNWAIDILTNASPAGGPLFRDLQRWALEAWLGLDASPPEPVAASCDELEAYAGQYRSIGYVCTVAADNGRLTFSAGYSHEVTKMLHEAQDEPPPEPPSFAVGMLPCKNDRFVILDGHSKGRVGYFGRGADGSLTGVHLFGRWLRRLT
jgi:CubicO group peptidase (beta-lactamase class C family)